MKKEIGEGQIVKCRVSEFNGEQEILNTHKGCVMKEIVHNHIANSDRNGEREETLEFTMVDSKTGEEKEIVILGGSWFQGGYVGAPLAFRDLPREEQISVLVEQASGVLPGTVHMEDEIYNILSIYTALNMGEEADLPNGFPACEFTTAEIIEFINFWLLSESAEQCNMAWDIIFATLGIDIIYDIVFNIGHHMKRYNELMQPVQASKAAVLKKFVDEHY